MRESESGNVRKEPVGDFIVGQVAIIGVALPRTKMHFVDRDGSIRGTGSAPVLHPRIIGPAAAAEWRNDRRGTRCPFASEGERIGFEREQLAARTEQLEFVPCSEGNGRQED